MDITFNPYGKDILPEEKEEIIKNFSEFSKIYEPIINKLLNYVDKELMSEMNKEALSPIEAYVRKIRCEADSKLEECSKF